MEIWTILLFQSNSEYQPDWINTYSMMEEPIMYHLEGLGPWKISSIAWKSLILKMIIY